MESKENKVSTKKKMANPKAAPKGRIVSLETWLLHGFAKATSMRHQFSLAMHNKKVCFRFGATLVHHNNETLQQHPASHFKLIPVCFAGCCAQAVPRNKLLRGGLAWYKRWKLRRPHQHLSGSSIKCHVASLLFYSCVQTSNNLIKANCCLGGEIDL